MTGAVGAPLPPTDATGTTAMNATAGKVALVSGATALACNGDSTPCDAAQAAQIVDLVGYGTANFSEGARRPHRRRRPPTFAPEGGCIDTDVNSADFAAGAPAPRSSGTAPAPCGAAPATRLRASSRRPRPPARRASPRARTSSVIFSEPVARRHRRLRDRVRPSGAHPPPSPAAPTTFSLDPAADFSAGESCAVTVAAAAGARPRQRRPAGHDGGRRRLLVQGLAAGHADADPRDPGSGAHLAARRADASTTTGIVTATRPNGFYLQDPSRTPTRRTSEAIFVFTARRPRSRSVTPSR